MRRSIFLIVGLLVGIFFLINYISQDTSATKLFELPNGRAECRAMMRSNEVSPEKVNAARRALKQKHVKSSLLKDGAIGQWKELGPNDEAGRVRAIATHPTDPDILFAGGANGGIWKSTDQGANWNALNDLMPSLSISDIIIDPDHPDTMFVATGESITGGKEFIGSSPGAGIFRSGNGGNTWNLVPALDPNDLSHFYWVGAIAYDVNDPSIFYAGSNGSGQATPSGGCANLYKFSDYGNTKTEIVSFPCYTGAITNIVINPNDADHIMVGMEGALIISWDGGGTWSGMNSFLYPNWPDFSNRVEVAMSASDANTVYALCQGASLGSLLKSIDKGMSWTSIRSDLTIFTVNGRNNGWYHNTIWVNPLDVDELIVGGLDLHKSTNGGSILIKISDWTDNNSGTSPHADHHIIVAPSDYSNTNKKLYFGNDGGIASTDNWKTVSENSGWVLLNNNLGITQFYASDFHGNSPQVILGGSQDNGTIISYDSGNSWEVLFGGDGGYCAVSKQDQNLQYLSTQGGVFYVTCNTPPFTGDVVGYFNLKDYEADTLFIVPMEIFPNDGTQIVVGGIGLWHVQYSSVTCAGTVTNIGRVPVIGRYISAIDISKDGSLIYVGYTNGLVDRGELSGGTWNWTDVNIIHSRTITDIAIHHSNYDKVVITTGGYFDDNIWLTNNGGIDWVERSSGIPALHINCLAWHPEVSNWIYAGTDMGIMASEDNGQNWNTTPSFLETSDGPAFVEISDIGFTRENTLGGHSMVVTTYGRGMWKSKYLVNTDLYVDENSTNVIKNGRETTPFLEIQDAEERQAHGQTWHVDGGTYEVDTSKVVIIDKRIGELKLTGTGAVIIGEN